ncbi:MAG: RIP metalloprotease RseP [Firmicutes bacterium]|nr:RIP metalloprotease RseP [Bacillota bacterium]
MMTIIYFILILGITVFIHELGHFMFAKKYGVYVYEFSIGMGPKIFKFNRKNDETDYCIRLFPIGGFVQMAGEEVEVDETIPEEKRLQSKTAFQRFMIMVAGVMMNFILAFVLLFLLGLFNRVSVNNVYINSSVINNLNDNDKIVAVNGRFVNNYDKLALEMTIAADKDFTMTVKDQNGNKKDVTVTPVAIGKSNLPYQKNYGFEVNDVIVTNSSINGVSEGDTITAVNGVNVATYLEMVNELAKSEDSLTLTLKDKQGLTKESKVTVTENKDDQLLGYSYGFYIAGEEAKGFFGAIKYAFLKFISTIEQMVFTVFYLITGDISLSMLSGPVGIFNVVGQSAKAGFSSVVSLLCLICINVGFINFLPLPAMDGGHILFIIVEKIKGSKVNPKIENMIHNIGFILLMLLMILVTYNDILRLF